MAKKYKSTKMLKSQIKQLVKPQSAFGSHANRLADSRKKKIQKLSDTQKRLLQSKKNNKMIKVSKKAKKFALLDQQDQQTHQNYLGGLTHKGKNIKDLKEFDDVNFNESDLQNDEQFDDIHDKLNFAGFQVEDNLIQTQKLATNNNNEQNKQKTKTQIYKQIIQKSKAYKLFRQQVYEQNLQKAKQLDIGFSELTKQLKFRNQDKKIRDKIEGRDLQYDRLINELKQDERIVSNKIVERKEKDTEKIRKKKNQQLEKIMRDSDGEEGDIRGWVDGNINDNQDEQESDVDSQEKDDNNQVEDEENEESYDQLDDVNLSSSGQEDQSAENEEGDDQEQEEEEKNQEEVEGEDDQQVGEQDEQDEVNADEEDSQEDDQDQDQGEQDEQHEDKPSPPQYKDTKSKFQSHINTAKNLQPSAPEKIKSRPAPQHSSTQASKKRKLNTIY